MPSIHKYRGPFKTPELLHLLRRTLFGVSVDDLKIFNGKSLQECIDVLIPKTPILPSPPLRTYYSHPDPSLDQMEKFDNNGSVEITVPFGTTWVNTPLQSYFFLGSSNNRRASLKTWRTGLQIHQDRSLYEKMLLFYQTLLVTQDSVVEDALLMYSTQSLYRKHAFGNYKQLIKEISLDPGMLKYLNGEKNSKLAPDENYAREIQELFTLGKGPGSQYTEEDVRQAAKIFTGWSVQYSQTLNGKQQNILPRVIFNQNKHDTSDKVFSSFYNNAIISPDISINSDQDRALKEMHQFIELIFSKEEVAKYICRRLWRFFVYYEINNTVEQEIIEPLSEVFRTYEQDPDQMRYVMQALFSSELFFHPQYRSCMIKSPSDFIVGMLRQIDFPFPDSSKLEAQYYMWGFMRSGMVNAGFDINDPPDVAGWTAYYQQPAFYELWYDTTSFPFRRGMYEAISRSSFSLDKKNTYDSANNPSYGYTVKMNFTDLIVKLKDPSDPNSLIDELCELLLAPPLSDKVKKELKDIYLLRGQSNDYYWSEAWQVYINDPNTNDPVGKQIPQMLQNLVNYLMSSAEYQLC